MALPDVTLMVLCNPQNPTGTVWKREELERLAELAKKYDVVVFSDEIYAEFCFLDQPVVPFAAIPAAMGHAISCTGLGKAFNFTGVNHANNLIPDLALREAFTTQRNRDHYGSIDPIAYTSFSPPTTAMVHGTGQSINWCSKTAILSATSSVSTCLPSKLRRRRAPSPSGLTGEGLG